MNDAVKMRSVGNVQVRGSCQSGSSVARETENILKVGKAFVSRGLYCACATMAVLASFGKRGGWVAASRLRKSFMKLLDRCSPQHIVVLADPILNLLSSHGEIDMDTLPSLSTSS